MNKLIGVLIIATACASATAQQVNKQPNAAAASEFQANKLPQTDRAAPLVPTFKFVIELPQAKPQEEGRLRFERYREGFVVLTPQWVFKDGAVYLDVLGNGRLIPVPGGGASGCFDLNLRERIEKLRTTIEALPPRPQSPAPRK